jgi:molybdopterin synthase sulfur carrier subunit
VTRVATVSIRLFAAAREAAGRGSDTIEGATVDEVLERARAAYGPQFALVLHTARVWVNGEEPLLHGATVLLDGDEVAVLPPVSGGCRP